MDPPTPPNEEDCCSSGCNPCIFDVYEEKLRGFAKNSKHNLQYPSFKNCISQTSYSVFKLISKEWHTRNTFLLTFEYVNTSRKGTHNDLLNLRLHFEPGQHFLVKADRDGGSEHFTRAYTPLLCDTSGRLQFRIVVRRYDRGLMSQILTDAKVNDESLWRGPYGNFRIDYTYRHVLAIVQGTGIAPVYSVLRRALDDDAFESFVKLYYCCRSMDDAPLRDDLHSMLRYWNFAYEVFVSDPTRPADLKYNETIRERKLSGTDVRNYLEGKENAQVLICGGESFGRCMLDYLGDVDRGRIYLF